MLEPQRLGLSSHDDSLEDARTLVLMLHEAVEEARGVGCYQEAIGRLPLDYRD